MTKNHILIKSVALGVLLMLSPLAKANNVDQVLIAYFNKLYPSNPQNCVIDSYTKTTLLADFEQKQCLNRITSEGQQYIAGFKSPCNEKDARASLDSQINAFCFQQVQKANAAAQAKQQQQQQPSASGGSSGGSSGGGVDAKAGLATAKKILSGYQKIDKWAKKYEEKKEEKSGKVEEIPPVGSSTIYGNKGAPAVNAAINKANQEIRAHNNAASTPQVTSAEREQAQKDFSLAQDNYDKAGCGTEDNAYSEDCKKLDTELIAAHEKMKALGQPGAPTSPDLTPEGSQAAINGEQPAVDQSLQNLPAGAQEAGKAAVNGNAAAKSDPELEARKAKAAAEDAALDTQIKAIDTALQAASKALPEEANAKCAANEATRDPITMQTKNPELEKECNLSEPQKAIVCLNTNYQKLKAEQPKLKESKESCSQNSAQAAKLCSVLRSDKAQDVQKLMSVGATILSKVTAASEACGTTSDISKVAQGGMLLAQGACTAMKFRCDMSCASAKKSLEDMKLASEAIQKCQLTLQAIASSGAQAKEAAAKLTAELTKQVAPKEGAVPQSIAQCIKHKADIALMGVAALGFLSAFQDAQNCKKQLASGGGGSGKSTSSMVTPTMTTAEYCSQPQNATSITCKCTANPSAEGCMGSMAGSGVALGKIGSGSGASAFASAKQNGLGGLDPLGKSTNGSSEPAPGSNLSEGAREALGIGGGATVDASSGGSPAGLSGNSENAKGLKDKEEKEKPKFGFFSSIGNMLSGGKSPNQAAKAAIRGYEQDQAIKRKLASDQIRAEITTASGKSNFDKIKSAYKANSSSFEQ